MLLLLLLLLLLMVLLMVLLLLLLLVVLPVLVVVLLLLMLQVVVVVVLLLLLPVLPVVLLLVLAVALLLVLPVVLLLLLRVLGSPTRSFFSSTLARSAPWCCSLKALRCPSNRIRASAASGASRGVCRSCWMLGTEAWSRGPTMAHSRRAAAGHTGPISSQMSFSQLKLPKSSR
jgi:hypothetical protein